MGFARSLLNLYEKHVGAKPGRRDLRYKPQLEGGSNPIDHFKRLPMGDVWEDASLLDPLKYLFNSKLMRWDCNHWIQIMFKNWCCRLFKICATDSPLIILPCRIPMEWKDTMTTFVLEYENEARLIMICTLTNR